MEKWDELVRWPRISIVTPSFNQSRYLPETIESILGQGYPNLEYVIIDGGSTDGSVEIIKRYESHLSYWVSEKDRGQSDAINKGFRRCTGDLFNWINSDDILFPGALHQIARIYAKDPTADLFVGASARADAEGRIWRVSYPACSAALSPKNWVLAMGQQSIFISSKMYEKVGGVREDLHCIMDSELYYRIYAQGGRSARVPALLGMIRDHVESKGMSRADDWVEETANVYGQYGVSNLCHRRATKWMRLCRLFDGSYARSFALTSKWRGRRPWGSRRADACVGVND